MVDAKYQLTSRIIYHRLSGYKLKELPMVATICLALSGKTFISLSPRTQQRELLISS